MRGFTLIELMVALAVIAVMLGVVSVSFANRHGAMVGEPSASTRAVELGIPVRVLADSVTSSTRLFLPDGRALGDGVDPLTGELIDVP